MNVNKILSGQSFLPHKNPKKLIFLLHGYGDTAENFIQISRALDDKVFRANYFALNAPSPIPNYATGRQWFNLYPNGVYISNAGPKEIEIIRLEILKANQMLENTINREIDKYKLSFKDCFLLGFSQGGMMSFEFGDYFKKTLGGLIILSGQIMKKDVITNEALLKTPIFISHGDCDDVLPVKLYHKACSFLELSKMTYDSYVLKGDSHTISVDTISLFQKFIKKNL